MSPLKNTAFLFAVAGAWLMPQAMACRAGAVNLWGTADGDTAYYEQYSDAFYRMDLYDAPPRETQQRFHLISNPSATIGSTSFDGFPNDEDFRLGSVAYDDADLVDGSGTADITALALGIGHDPGDPGHINYNRWSPEHTVVLTFAGTVDVAAGVVTSINIESTFEFHFTVIANQLVSEPGTFTLAGNRYDGYVYYVIPNTNGQQLIWDFTGTLTTVGSTAVVGDYNDDRTVDVADFVIWRKVTDTGYNLLNRDPDLSGDVGRDDYAAWRENFGNTVTTGSATTFGSPVPEPGLLSLALTLAFALHGVAIADKRTQTRLRRVRVARSCRTVISLEKSSEMRIRPETHSGVKFFDCIDQRIEYVRLMMARNQIAWR